MKYKQYKFGNQYLHEMGYLQLKETVLRKVSKHVMLSQCAIIILSFLLWQRTCLYSSKFE